MSQKSTGNVVVRILLIVLGVILALFGLILTIAFIALLVEEGDPTMAFMLPFTLATTAGGIVIIVGQATAFHHVLQESNTVAGALSPESVASAQQEGFPTRTAPQIPAHVASQPVVPGNDVQDAAQSTPQGETPQTPGDSATEDVAHLVFRADDLFATLRDLVRHESVMGSNKYHLASMLAAAGVMNWPDAPACEGGRLSRNTHFWIRLNTDELNDTQYDTLIATEAALSVNQDLPLLRALPLDDANVKTAALDLMRTMVDQTVERPSITDEGIRAANPFAVEGTSGEWAIRSIICNAAESIKTPFRVDYDLRANTDTGQVVLSLETPRPRCMAIFTSNPSEQVALARAYAVRLSALLARHAFEASEQIQSVIVNVHEHAHDETLLSLKLDRHVLASLLSVARGDRLELGFPQDPAIRARFTGSWFEPVGPFCALDDPQNTSEAAHSFPELDTRDASDAVQRACHVKRICDLGINENAGRIAAWNAIRPQLGTTTSQAVSILVAARAEAQDITVAEACTRIITGLVDGTADLENLQQLAALFIEGSALEQANARASALLDDSDGIADPERALSILKDALAPIEDMGAYLDDETSVYRYFGSVSERIEHNKTIDEGGREVRLVPDAYFNAHYNASIAHGMLKQSDDALRHAEICRHLAPTSTHAAMRVVRALEDQSRIYEAADCIISTLRHAVTPRDAAICHYRLAYMEWKLGREDLGVACYQRALSWDTEFAQQAREELDDLLTSNPQLTRLSDEQADALLAREGIPLGCVRADYDHTLAAAVACIDDHAFYSARGLTAALFGMEHDDVMMGVYRSLNVSS